MTAFSVNGESGALRVETLDADPILGKTADPSDYIAEGESQDWRTHRISIDNEVLVKNLKSQFTLGQILDLQGDEGAVRVLEGKIQAKLREHSIEDGYRHPAEALIIEGFVDNPVVMKEWLAAIFWRGFSNPDMVALVLRSIISIPPQLLGNVGKLISASALVHPSVQIREAAIFVFENWGDPASIALLKNYQEPIGWLREYRDSVVLENELSRTQNPTR